MAPARHKEALRAAWPHLRSLRKVGAAAAVTTLAVAGGVAVALPEEPAESVSAISMAVPEVRSSPVPVRVQPISRSESRVRLEPKPPEVTGHRFATDAVNIRALPREDSRRVGSLEWAERVSVSGVTRGKWTEVVIDKQSRWVHSDYLAKKKPQPEPEPEPEEVEEEQEAAETSSAPAPSGLSMAPCPSGSSVESGLTANAVAVHRAICGAFPQITSYGGYRADSGAHGSGRGLDAMVSGDLGWQVAEYVRANAGELGVSEVIFSQKIWTVERGSEGWRYMEDRGSTTANHYDHVHVTVY